MLENGRNSEIISDHIQIIIPWSGRTLQLAEKSRGELPQFLHRRREDPVRELAGRERPALLCVPQCDPSLLFTHIGSGYFAAVVWHVANIDEGLKLCTVEIVCYVVF